MDQDWNDILSEMKTDNVPDAVRAKVAINYFNREIAPEMLADNVPAEHQAGIKSNFLNTLSTPPEKQSFFGPGNGENAPVAKRKTATGIPRALPETDFIPETAPQAPVASALPAPAVSPTGWTPGPSTLPVDPVGQFLNIANNSKKEFEILRSPLKKKSQTPSLDAAEEATKTVADIGLSFNPLVAGTSWVLTETSRHAAKMLSEAAGASPEEASKTGDEVADLMARTTSWNPQSKIGQAIANKIGPMFNEFSKAIGEVTGPAVDFIGQLPGISTDPNKPMFSGKIDTRLLRPVSQFIGENVAFSIAGKMIDAAKGEILSKTGATRKAAMDNLVQDVADFFYKNSDNPMSPLESRLMAEDIVGKNIDGITTTASDLRNARRAFSANAQNVEAKLKAARDPNIVNVEPTQPFAGKYLTDAPSPESPGGGLVADSIPKEPPPPPPPPGPAAPPVQPATPPPAAEPVLPGLPDWVPKRKGPVSIIPLPPVSLSPEGQVAAPPAEEKKQAEHAQDVSTPVEPLDRSKYPVVQMPLSQIEVDESIIPNFKKEADKRTGIVQGQRLEGQFDELGTAPIVVYQTNDGRNIIATGRHRLDLARRTDGKDTIAAQVIKESDGWTPAMAAIVDAEQNIKDEKGTVEDHARYFRHNKNITEDEARSRGLLSRLGQRDAWAVGKDAGSELFSHFTSGTIKSEPAAAIARAAPQDEGLQRAGIWYALKNKNASGYEVENFLTDLKHSSVKMPGPKQTDMFGNDSSVILAEARSKLAGKKLSAFMRERSALSLGRKSKEMQEAARRAGIDVTNEEQVIERIEELNGQIEQWKRWSTTPELRQRLDDELSGGAKAAPSGGLPREPVALGDQIREANSKSPPGLLTQYEKELARAEGSGTVEVPKGARIALENSIFSELSKHTGELGGRVASVGSDNVGEGIFEIERPYGKIIYNEATGGITASQNTELISAMAADRARFGVDKTLLLQTISKDIVNNDLSGTIANETIQNAVDVLRKAKGDKIIDISIESDYDQDGTALTIVKVTDTGAGMTRHEVEKNLLRLGAKGKAGTDTSGGYGLAKAAFILTPKSTVVTTTKDGKQTILKGTREQFFGVKGVGDPSIETLDVNAPGGTTFEMSFYADGDAAGKANTFAMSKWGAGDAFKKYVEEGIFVGDIKIGLNRLGRTFTETKAPSDLEQLFPKEKVSVLGNNLSIYFVRDPHPPSRSWTKDFAPHIITLNKGLRLFSIEGNHYRVTELFEQPEWQAIVDFDKTPGVQDVNYPFLRNRTTLNAEVQKKVKAIIDEQVRKINEKDFANKKVDFDEMVRASPIINGIRILIPFKDKVEFGKTEQLLNENSQVVTDLAGIFKSFKAVLEKIGGKAIDLTITVDPKVHGYRSNPKVTGHEFYAINPFAVTGSISINPYYIKLLGAGYDKTTAMAANLVHVLVHEYVHNRVQNHSEDFTLALADTYMQISHGVLARLEQQARRFYENHESGLTSIQGHLAGMGKGGSRFQDSGLAVRDIEGLTGISTGRSVQGVGHEGIRAESRITGQPSIPGLTPEETFVLTSEKAKARPIPGPKPPEQGAFFTPQETPQTKKAKPSKPEDKLQDSLFEPSAPYESALDKDGNYDIVQAKAKGLASDELERDINSYGTGITSQRLPIPSARGTVAKPGGVKTIASAIPQDLIKHGFVSLRGAEIKNARDLAAAAQIFRDPRIETLRIFYVKEGKIVGHEGLSNRMPGFVSFYATEKAQKEVVRIHSRIKRLGADQVYLLHNHPGGRPVPSGNDIAFTKLLSEAQIRGVESETEALPLISHVIIDDKQYAEIFRFFEGPGVSWDYKVHDLPEGKEYGEPAVPHDLLAKEVNGQRDVAEIGKTLKRQEGYATLIYRSSTGRLAGIQDVPVGLLKGPEAMGFLKNRAREFGARETMIYVDDVDSIGVPRIKHLIEYGGVRDVLSKDQGFAKQYQPMQGVVFGEPITKYQPMRVSEEATAYMTDAERKEYVERERRIIELPEIVEIAKKLMGGKYPKTKAFLGAALGRFYPGKGKIEVINGMDQKELARVLAHEIGHLNDWLPDKSMRKGNILGRIASILDYRKSLLAEYPNAPGKILTDKDRARLRSEAEKQVKKEVAGNSEIVEEITRTVPLYEKTAITPEMILDILRGRTNEPDVLLRFLQEVDGSTKKEIAKQALKNLVDESLAGLEGKKIIGYETKTERVVRPSKTKTEEAALVAKRYRELLKEEILKRRLYEQEVITRELKNLTQTWKPFTEVPGSQYTKYRLSSKELYADAMSVLMNDPSLLKRIAPIFNKAFFNWLDKKPEFKAFYDAMQERIEDPETMLAKRDAFQRGMAERGAKARAARSEDLRKSFSLSTLGREIKRRLMEKHALSAEKVREWEKAGKAIPDEMRIDYWTEKLPYIDSRISAFTKDVENLIDDSVKKNVSVVDLHVYMLNKRAATERAGIYNPGGIGDEFANKQLDYMRRTLGDQKFKDIEKSVDDFRNLFVKHVLTIVDKASFLPSKLMLKLWNNPHYATFGSLDHMEARDTKKTADTIVRGLSESLGGVGQTARIYRQYGMLGEVDNVFIQTILKGQALIRAARHHETKMALLTALAKEGAKGEIIEAKRGPKGVGWESPPDNTYGTIVVSPQGQAQAYHTDKEFADIWNHQPDQATMLMTIGMLQKAFLAKVYIGWNMAWTVMNPFKDIQGTWLNLPETSGFIFKGYAKTAGDMLAAGFGKFPEREKRLLMEEKIYPDRFWMTERNWDAQERELLAHTMDPSRYERDAWGEAVRALDYIKKNKLDRYMLLPPALRLIGNVGQSLERWGKFGPEEALTMAEKSGRIPPLGEMRKGHLVINRAGTPNPLAQGLWTKGFEFLFPFGNIGMQGLRATGEAARERPWTYGFKTFIANILPTLLFSAMVAGFFDWISEDIKNTAKKAGKYLRRMYHLIPIGSWKDDGVFLSLPKSYPGQVQGAIIDSIITGDFTGTAGAISQTIAAEPYHMSPVLDSLWDWISYYGFDAVPRNSFYGADIMSKQVAEAGGKEAFKALSRETWNNFFGGLLYRFRPDSVTETNTEIKDLLGSPASLGLGKFIRITDQGIREWNRNIVEKVRKLEAQEHIELKKSKIETINKLITKPTLEDAHRYWSVLVEEGKIDYIQTPFRTFANSYIKMGTHKEGNPYIDAFASATTNRQKATYLEEWKKGLKPQEYKQIFNMLAESRLIPPAVERKIENLK